MFFLTGYDGEKNPKSHIFSVDAATLSTAIATNNKLVPLDALSRVSSMDLGGHLFGAYIDEYYAPMQPTFCLNTTYFQELMVAAVASNQGGLTDGMMGIYRDMLEIAALGGEI